MNAPPFGLLRCASCLRLCKLRAASKRPLLCIISFCTTRYPCSELQRLRCGRYRFCSACSRYPLFMCWAVCSLKRGWGYWLLSFWLFGVQRSVFARGANSPGTILLKLWSPPHYKLPHVVIQTDRQYVSKYAWLNKSARLFEISYGCRPRSGVSSS
jgi:hypothetical protein